MLQLSAVGDRGQIVRLKTSLEVLHIFTAAPTKEIIPHQNIEAFFELSLSGL